jgi:hypothetical protein
VATAGAAHHRNLAVTPRFERETGSWCVCKETKRVIYASNAPQLATATVPVLSSSRTREPNSLCPNQSLWIWQRRVSRARGNERPRRRSIYCAETSPIETSPIFVSTDAAMMTRPIAIFVASAMTLICSGPFSSR